MTRPEKCCGYFFSSSASRSISPLSKVGLSILMVPFRQYAQPQVGLKVVESELCMHMSASSAPPSSLLGSWLWLFLASPKKCPEALTHRSVKSIHGISKMSSRTLNQVARWRIIFADHQTLLTMGLLQLLLQANCRKNGEEIQHGFDEHRQKSLTPPGALGFEASGWEMSKVRFEMHLRPHSSFEASMRKTVGLFPYWFQLGRTKRKKPGHAFQFQLSAEPAWPGMRPNSSGLVWLKDLAIFCSNGCPNSTNQRPNGPKDTKGLPEYSTGHNRSTKPSGDHGHSVPVARSRCLP